eukprot:2815246-Prymnesium_polylepis.1
MRGVRHGPLSSAKVKLDPHSGPYPLPPDILGMFPRHQTPISSYLFEPYLRSLVKPGDAVKCACGFTTAEGLRRYLSIRAAAAAAAAATATAWSGPAAAQRMPSCRPT